VAITLAFGVAASMIILMVGVVWGAIKHGSTAATLTENETQVLIAAFGGVFGILGAFLGFRAGNGRRLPPHTHVTDDDTPQQWPQRERP